MEEAEVEVEAAAVAAVYRRHHRFSIPQTRRPMLLLPQSQPLRQRPFPLRNSSLLRLAHKHKHIICVAFSFLPLKEKQTVLLVAPKCRIYLVIMPGLYLNSRLAYDADGGLLKCSDMYYSYIGVETGTINMYKYNLRAYVEVSAANAERFDSASFIVIQYEHRISRETVLYARDEHFFFILCTSPENFKTGARAYAECVKLRSRIRNDRYFVIIN